MPAARSGNLSRQASSGVPNVPSFGVNNLIGLDKYYRSANLLLRQVKEPFKHAMNVADFRLKRTVTPAFDVVYSLHPPLFSMIPMLKFLN